VRPLSGFPEDIAYYVNQAMLMANGIVPRPLDASYHNINANYAPRAVNYDETPIAEIQRLEVASSCFFTASPHADLMTVEIEYPSLSSRTAKPK